MLKRVIGIGVVGLVLILAAACGSDDNGGGSAASGGGAGASGKAGAGFGGTSGTGGNGGGASGSGGIALQDLPGKYAESMCAAFESCFGVLYAELFGAEDCSQLFGRMLENGDFSSLQQAVDSGKLTYDGAKMQACLDRIAQSGCQLLTEREFEECVLASDGTIVEGGDCNFDFECKSPAFCKVEGACPGVCAPLLGAGAACTEHDQCQAGLVCTDPGTCQKPAALGQSCQTGSATPCEPGLLCMGGDPSAGTPGICKSPSELFIADLAADCNPAGGPYCKPGLSCAVIEVSPSIVTKCVAESSSACSYSIPDMCATGSYCSVPEQQFQGTCTPLPSDGQPCAADGKCAAYVRCVSGTCRKMQDNGGSCAASAVCYGGACVGGKCEADTPCN